MTSDATVSVGGAIVIVASLSPCGEVIEVFVEGARLAAPGAAGESVEGNRGTALFTNVRLITAGPLRAQRSPRRSTSAGSALSLGAVMPFSASRTTANSIRSASLKRRGAEPMARDGAATPV